VERGNLYGFLALVFQSEPTLEFLREIRSPPLMAALSDAGVDFGEAFRRDPEDDLLRDLGIDFTRLFVGPGKHIAPYESAQLEGALWGAATAKVAAFIESRGFRYRSDFQDMPDHISVEFEFMKEMIGREAEALEHDDADAVAACRRSQAVFLEQHVSRWVPQFCEKVANEAALPFYRDMARLTADFIRSERDEAAIGEGGEPGPV
jgi:TorA maturation chaperone TorD